MRNWKFLCLKRHTDAAPHRPLNVYSVKGAVRGASPVLSRGFVSLLTPTAILSTASGNRRPAIGSVIRGIVCDSLAWLYNNACNLAAAVVVVVVPRRKKEGKKKLRQKSDFHRPLFLFSPVLLLWLGHAESQGGLSCAPWQLSRVRHDVVLLLLLLLLFFSSFSDLQ